MIEDYLGKKINVIIDRPMGSKHPDYDMIYPINYGYVPNTISGDNEELDVYVLGVNEPIKEFCGKCIAIIHRINDNDDKLIVSNIDYSDLEIENMIYFQEKYFKHILLREKIEFRKLEDNDNDYNKLYNWCNKKIVYEWFEQRQLSFNEIKEKYHNKLINKKQDLFIIKYNNKDIGLVQIYKNNNDYEFDLFIGEEDYLSKGIGTKIVNLVSEKIFKDYQANGIILHVFKRNERAIKCYIKCGYKIIKEYSDVDTLGNKERMIMLKRGEL